MEDQIHRLLQIILQINKSEKYSAWFSFSGHVHNIDIRISLKNDYKNYIYSESFYIDIDSKITINSIIEHLIENYLINYSLI